MTSADGVPVRTASTEPKLIARLYFLCRDFLFAIALSLTLENPQSKDAVDRCQDIVQYTLQALPKHE